MTALCFYAGSDAALRGWGPYSMVALRALTFPSHGSCVCERALGTLPHAGRRDWRPISVETISNDKTMASER